MKINYKTILITMIIASLTNCNQVVDTKTAENIEKSTPSKEEDSYFSKKGYQNKLTKWFRPYQIDVQQGNIITPEMLNDVKVGMTKEQVRHVLGTSVLTENFEKNHWIYAFSNSVNGKIDKEQILVLSFKNDKLNNIKENTIATG